VQKVFRERERRQQWGERWPVASRERLVCDQLPCMTYLPCIFSTLRIGKITPERLARAEA